jgi:hypothetical protein
MKRALFLSSGIEFGYLSAGIGVLLWMRIVKITNNVRPYVERRTL